MPFVSNDGVRAHYHVEGDGSPLVLMHRWSNSLEYWRDFGYVDELKSDYQLGIMRLLRVCDKLRLP